MLYFSLRINKRRLDLIFEPQDQQKEASLASGVRQHTKKLEKTNKQNRFQELHHPEDRTAHNVRQIDKEYVTIGHKITDFDLKPFAYQTVPICFCFVFY
jgi:hypothetical protein